MGSLCESKAGDLIERIFQLGSKPDDLILDAFCGSGSTLIAAERQKRRWIGIDLARWSIHLSRKRLLEEQHCKPFEILNFGKYERQYWQDVTLGGGKDPQTLIYEYLAFVLKLYKAQPISGMHYLHGKRGRAVVHIGAIDSPVTIDEVNLAIDECVRAKQQELHVLGWEWEMGLAGPNNDVKRGSPMHEIAKQRGVKLLLLQIPREVMEQQAVTQGDIQFFELAYLEVAIKQSKKLSAQIKLKNFVIPNTDLIPEDIREKVKKWSDYIDYWAVDWNFQSDTFMQGWVTYRSRKGRYASFGKRSLPVPRSRATIAFLSRSSDVFGNDTSQAYPVEVK